MALKLYYIWLPTTSQTLSPPLIPQELHWTLWTKNTQSKLLGQVLGTYCCLCLKHTSFRYHYSGSVTSFRSLLKCQLITEDLPGHLI